MESAIKKNSGWMFKTPGIPTWMTIFALILFALGAVLGISAFIGQGAEPFMNASWGGRHLGIGVAAGLAVLLRSPSAYFVIFAASVIQNLGDLIAEVSKAEPSMGPIVGVLLFTTLSIAGCIWALKARRAGNS